jgi:type IV pilus assembly protein PilB
MSGDLPSIEDLLKAHASSNDDSSSSTQTTDTSEGSEVINDPDTKKTDDQIPKRDPGATLNLSNEKTNEALSNKLEQVELRGKEAVVKAEGAAKGFEYIALKGFPISPDTLTLIPEEKARELKAVVFLHSGPEIRIGARHPEDEKVEELRFQLGERFKSNAVIYQISDESLEEALKLYATLPKIKEIVKGVQIKAEELEQYQSQMTNFEDIDKVIDGASITDILAILVAAALKLGSSDIHIEAEEKDIAVRFRVDGVLVDVATLEKESWKKIISRIKLIASLKLNITDAPQDGRFTIFQKNKKIDVRTSTIPTAWGESVVMRILNPDSIQLEFEELGFRPAVLKRLMPEIQKPNGMIVTTGPTGSGKTTTLYSILRKLNQPDVKIITLEDPVEYKLSGINQSQIDHAKNYSFADGIRSILRQDPDIVMVGEIRDLETADAAIQAALTGHLLLSTIHTNNAAGAIPRFLSMGVKPFLLAPAISVVMGQRLLRRLCKECKKPADIEEAKLAQINSLLNAIPENSGETVPTERTFYAAEGCKACNGTGYKGRVGVYEILIKNKEIEEFILSENVSEYAMLEVATKQGMVTMAQDALLKALDGLTSIEEVERVTSLDA